MAASPMTFSDVSEGTTGSRKGYPQALRPAPGTKTSPTFETEVVGSLYLCLYVHEVKNQVGEDGCGSWWDLACKLTYFKVIRNWGRLPST